MASRWFTFGPLVRVPSAFLNRVQDSLFTQRGNGADNTGSLRLDGDNANLIGRTVVFSIAQPAGIGFSCDGGIDWRDRDITVNGWADPNRDIRPGSGFDSAFPKWIFRRSFYSGTSGVFDLGNGFELAVGITGVLGLVKPAAFLHLIVTGTAQVKERT